MLADIVTVRAKVDFKFGQHQWEKGKFYKVHKPIADLFTDPGWVMLDGEMGISFADEKAEDRATVDHLREFLAIVANEHLDGRKPLITLTAHPPKG